MTGGGETFFSALPRGARLARTASSSEASRRQSLCRGVRRAGSPWRGTRLSSWCPRRLAVNTWLRRLTPNPLQLI